MPKIDVMNYSIYYEIYGNEEGEPLVILNGLMMSTASWTPFIDVFSKYKLVLLDLIDQGQSTKAVGEEYTQERQADMLKEFFQKLNLNKVNLVGISYGGEVAMEFAIKYQDMIRALVLANTTSRTNAFMQDMGKGWEYATSTYDAAAFFKISVLPVYSVKFYEDNLEWMRAREQMFNKTLTPEWYDGVKRLIRSAEHLNVTDKIDIINVPTLLIGADEDTITPLAYQREIQSKIKNSQMVIIRGSGHGSMYERPYEFAGSIIGFLETYDKKITIK
ncbi:alpha/beta fold hydrolase [Clostridium bovifaecis]|uniref:Alpha/beta fold hydrolase n=1 Tax=Clostridium bovifaecis TaxID=2184719 RepID=A0A6I6F0E5_9CLOT|nr:alpha/beta fold hydrolase [Clostridium bovifaecis]